MRFSTSNAWPWIPATLLLALLAGAYLALQPALDGSFLFDDYPNLKALQGLGGVDDWETFRAFVFGGFSGPTRRPLAMASFLLDTNTWPAPAYSFKYTNLLIHLLNGALLAWASLQLCRFYGVQEQKAQYFALFGATAWLVHPFLVSTTFYIVQRMAQLAALFCFAGITAYLHGRRLALIHPRAGYLWMMGGIGLGTLFATFSKENGALLPLLVLIIESCRPAGIPAAARWFRILFLYLPSLAVLAYLASRIDFSPHPWIHRPFNQPERLLTEARILWDYLGNLLLPRIEGAGLYQDGLAISRGWLTPLSTLPSVVGLGVVTVAAITLRRRIPLLAMAILFFLGGHLIESSLLGLEPYFEHRNYLPAAFLFLPIAQGLDTLRARISPSISIALAIGILAVLGFLAHQRALLWGKPEQLEMYWALAAPDSPRAQNLLVDHYLNKGEIARAEQLLARARARHPDSALLTMRMLLLKVQTRKTRREDFIQTADRLSGHPFDGQGIMALRTLVGLVIKPSNAILQLPTLEFIDNISGDPIATRFRTVRSLLPYLKGKIFLARKQFALAEQEYGIAIQRYKDIEAAMQMVAEMASARQYERALRLLQSAEQHFTQQEDKSLRFSRQQYQKEIVRVRQQLQQDLSANGKNPVALATSPHRTR